MKNLTLKNEIWNRFVEKNSNLIITLIYDATVVLGTAILYFLLPILLNYPPNFIEIANKYSLSYLVQNVLILLTILLVSSIFYLLILKGINIRDDNISQLSEIQSIQRKCFNLPYIIYITQIMIPVLIFLIVFPFIATFDVPTVKFVLRIAVTIFSIASLISTISLIFSRRLYREILLKTNSSLCIESKRIRLNYKIFLQIVPMIIASILFMSLIGYSRLIEEKGNLLYKLFKLQLTDKYRIPITQRNFNEDQLKQLLSKVNFDDINGSTFIVTPRKQIFTSDGMPLSKIFTIYLFEYFSHYDGHIYDRTGEIQGAAIKIKGIDGAYIVGVKYEVTSGKTLISFLIGFIVLFTINIAILSYFSKSLANDISLVANNLSKIAEGSNVDLDKRIPITSNDEIGDLVTAFNKIQEREKQHIEEIRRNQQMLLDRERLATLGQMVAGIAHNLRSPITSIAGGLEALKDLIKEYDESIDNDNVTKKDHHDIAREMYEWYESTKPYCAFMSDLISAVREQAVQLNTSPDSNFTLDELVKRIELLLKYELQKSNCTMKTDIQADLNTIIPGEINNLVQVCNNLILNAIQSYDGNRGTIEFKIAKQDDKLLFAIKDYGKGIPAGIQDKLLRQIITTKGKKGTGLGLYMSYLTVKGRFNGDLYFESGENEGTVFYVSIPTELRQ